MAVRPNENAVLRGATVFIGTVGCVLVGFRVARLLAVGLILGWKRGVKDEVKPPST